MRWGEENTLLFVRLYSNQVCLWDTNCVNYRNKAQRQEAYSKLAEDFYAVTNILLDEREVKTKIKNLRCTYSQELCKLRQHPNRKPSLRWFSEWKKSIKYHVKKDVKDEDSPNYLNCSKNEDSCDEDQKHTDTLNVSVWDLSENEGLDLNDSIDESHISANDNEAYLLLKSEPEENTILFNTEDNQTPYKFKKKKTKHSHNVDKMGTLKSSIDLTDLKKEDEFDIYGKYIASQLREMGLQKALQVQLQIQSIVSDARLEQLSENSGRSDN